MPSNPAVSLIRALKEFFETQSRIPAGTHCIQCGQSLLRTDGLFFLADGNEDWTVTLTLCPNCEHSGAHKDARPVAT